MKRAQASSPLQGSSSHKKQKILPSGNQEIADDDNVDGWTKVERRKTKKVQKATAKFDVWFLDLFFITGLRTAGIIEQATSVYVCE